MEWVVPREPRIHGDAMFPLGVYFVVLAPGPMQEFVAHHWHDEAEFIYVAKGAVDVQVGTQVTTVPCGQGVFVHGGEIHAMTAPDESDSECYAIVFNMELLSSAQYDTIQHQFVTPLLEHKVRLPTVFTGMQSWESTVLSYVEQIIALFEDKSSGHELGIKGLLCLILSTLAGNDQFMYERSAKYLDEQNLNRLKTVLAHIEFHFAEKIKLGDIAALVNMSEGHFCRYFKQMTNKRPVQYINDYRVNKAAALLQTTDRSVMDIALEVGFENLSYFIKVFGTMKQCTPSQYRHLISGHS